MIDFPSSPTVGQQFAAAGVIWTWDGTKWTAQGLSPTFLPLSGGVLSGPLGAPVVSLQNASGNANPLWGDIGGAARWLVELGDGAAETGANAGSNLAIVAYSDAAISLGADLTINRATGIVAAPSGLSAPQARNDNRIINGDMRIDQRTNGVGGTGAGVYTIDRWFYSATQASKGAWGRSTVGAAGQAAGLGYSLSFTSSSAYAATFGDNFAFSQRIEADMVNDLAWGSANPRPVTLSFWVTSSIAGTYSGALVISGANRSYPFTFSLPTANTWTKIAITIPGDSVGTIAQGNAEGMRLNFDLGAGGQFRGPAFAWGAGNLSGANGAASIVAVAGASINLSNVKLETGIVATDFNHQSLAKSLIDCQRYYQIGQLYLVGQAGTAGQIIAYGAPAPVVMRAIPTMTPVTNSSVNWTMTVLNYNANNIFVLQGTSVAAGAVNLNVVFTASAEL